MLPTDITDEDGDGNCNIRKNANNLYQRPVSKKEGNPGGCGDGIYYFKGDEDDEKYFKILEPGEGGKGAGYAYMESSRNINPIKVFEVRWPNGKTYNQEYDMDC